MIRGLIFDFDGLILETEGPDYQSWQETFAAHGCTLSLTVWSGYIGTASDAVSPYDHLEAQLGRPVDRAMVRVQRRQRYADLVALQSVLPGVEEYIAAGRRLGLHLGVASTSSRAWVAGHLERLGLLASFDAVCCGDEVPRPKPAPDVYQAVLATLGLAATEAIALEDSPNGIAAAKAAGLYCVAVPNALTGQLSLDAADRRLASLADVPLEVLVQEISLMNDEPRLPCSPVSHGARPPVRSGRHAL